MDESFTDRKEYEVLQIDCENFNCLCALSLEEGCECTKALENKKFDIVRLKGKFFTKEYDSNRRLLSITPFYIDVRFGAVTERVKVVEEYDINRTAAHVKILQRLDNVGYIYFLRIPETNVTFADLWKIHEELEKFHKTEQTTNEYIKRWYLQYGILEHLLFDENILEININPPADKTAIRIVHSKYDECISNIYPTEDFLNYLATRLKITTGRPLNKAQPQLDGEIMIENQKGRVAAIISPFSILGAAYSIRKHRELPWTFPLFISVGEINSWYAGLMSFAITHGRAFLIAGPRGSGKSAMLGSALLEILPKYRILTIEDTQELPIEAYKTLGYDLLPLKVRSALLKEGMEIPYEMGLRTSLRLGDSCLIVGEVRSQEAKVLYEAMRVGAMSNVVAGTIHADNPYGVFDRVVNDLGVPRGSFKVTDLIIIINQIKSPTGLHRVRRVMSVTEVLKEWEQEPKFNELLVYNPQTDQLEPTQSLLRGQSLLLNDVIRKSKGYKNYGSALRDIQLRGWAKDLQVKLAPDKSFLEAPYAAKANVLFTNLFEKLQPLESPSAEKLFTTQFVAGLKRIFKNK